MSTTPPPTSPPRASETTLPPRAAEPLSPQRAPKGKPLPTLLSELVDLVRSYATQETVEPLKGLARFVGFGVVGSVLLGLGLVELAVALLRLLQPGPGDVFDDNLSFVPYFIVMLVCVAVAALVMSRTRVRHGARG